MKIQNIYKESVVLLKSNRNIENPNLDVEVLLSFLLNIASNNLILYLDKEVDNKFVDNFYNLIKRRLNREPIANIINKKSFWDYEFFVDKNVLTPRNDSEMLIQAVLESFLNKDEQLNILDLGTGSGCLILTLLKLYKNSSGLAIDISENALEIAQKNSKLLKVNNIRFLHNNWNDNIDEKFDIIISNPPYISTDYIKKLEPEVNIFNPMLALDGGNDGLDCYRYLAANLKKNIKSNLTKVFLEIGQNQENKIIKIFDKNNFKIYKIYKDLGNINRVLVFIPNF